MYCMDDFVLLIFKQEPKGDISSLSSLRGVQFHDVFKLARLQEITVEVQNLVLLLASEEIGTMRTVG